jgi:hypothetical protein
VTKTTLQGAPVRPDTPTKVVITFNSTIERQFTKVVLVDAAGTETPLDVAVESAPGEVGVSLPALGAGQYGLRYRVLATDGHVTESMIRFRVAP